MIHTVIHTLTSDFQNETGRARRQAGIEEQRKLPQERGVSPGRPGLPTYQQGDMLETRRPPAAAMGASELSGTTTILACPRGDDSHHALLAGGLDVASPGSDSTEFFDALDSMPWSPERPAAVRHSPAAVAARRMQLALWPDTALLEPAAAAAEKSGISTAAAAAAIPAPTAPVNFDDVEPKVCTNGCFVWGGRRDAERTKHGLPTAAVHVG